MDEPKATGIIQRPEGWERPMGPQAHPDHERITFLEQRVSALEAIVRQLQPAEGQRKAQRN